MLWFGIQVFFCFVQKRLYCHYFIFILVCYAYFHRKIVDLVDPDQVERLPVKRMEELLCCRIPSILLAPFEASALVKIKMAIRLPIEERV